MANRHWRPASRIGPVGPPQPDQRPYVPQLVPRAGKLTELIAVHPEINWYVVHFMSGRTRPCLGNAVLCDGCSQGLSKRWEGYLGAVQISSHRVWVLKVTAGAWLNSETLQKADGNLRGKQLTCSRLGCSDNSALRISVMEAQRAVKLPPVWNLTETLARLWGYSSIGPLTGAEGVNLDALERAQEQPEGGEE